MTDPKIERYVHRFSEVIDRVIDHGKELLSNQVTETNLAAIAFTRNEISQMRNELAAPWQDFRGHKVIANDYQALVELIAASPDYSNFTVNEYGRVTELGQMYGRYASLDPIELLTELRQLSLIYVHVTDCSSLAELPNLKSFLTIGNTSLDWRTFRAMRALEIFDCEESPIPDLSWVSSCPNIKKLSVNSCSMDSIEDLRDCMTLEELDVMSNPVQSLAPIEGHLLIKKLTIRKTQIADFSPLTSLPSLNDLVVSKDIAELPSFVKSLRYLTEKGVKVTMVNEDPSPE